MKQMGTLAKGGRLPKIPGLRGLWAGTMETGIIFAKDDAVIVEEPLASVAEKLAAGALCDSMAAKRVGERRHGA